MTEKSSKKSKRTEVKSKTVRKHVAQDAEEDDDFNPTMEHQLKEVLPSPSPPLEVVQKKGPPMKDRKVKFHQESSNFQRTKAPQSLPTSMVFQQQTQNQTEWSYPVPRPLPPITGTQNLHEIYQTKLESLSIKAFKDYFLEQAPLTRNIECDASSLLTDVLLYELSQFDWPHLESIRIRACPNVTPFAMKYIQMIADKRNDQAISVNVELMLHAPNTIETKTELIDQTITKIESLLGKSTETSITKVLIYHSNTSMLSSQQMLINQIRKSKDDSPMLLDYLSSTQDECQVALLECTNFILFKELSTSFHPQIICLIVSSIDDVLQCFFSVDSNASFSILNNQEIRLIIKENNSNEQFLSDLQSRLNQISKSASELYARFIDDTPQCIWENDDFRRNHYLSSLLHVQTKCEMLQKKLTKDQCLILQPDDQSFVSTHLVPDAVKHRKILHTLGDNHTISNKVVETNELITKLFNELSNKSKEKSFNSTRAAQIYFTHRLLHDKVLDLHFTSHGKSYLLSDIEWFCRTMNQLFNTKTRVHRKSEHIVQQFKHTLGENIHLIFKRDLKNQKINDSETDFLQSLFTSWNLAYPFSTEHQGDRSNIFVLFNSIATEPPIPLSTVWAESLSTDDYESNIHFRLLHPCDSSILFHLYKLFPSQKLLLASKDFLLIQEGAMEILIQYHHQIGQNTDITVTSRLYNLNPPKDAANKADGLTNASFQYVISEYYMIIWAFLFQHDYAFQIEVNNQQSTNPFDDLNGNTLMNDRWRHLALYHYSSTPTLTSACSVCGLRPRSNKALYDACETLTPLRNTTQKRKDLIGTDQNEDESGLVVFQLDQESLSYTDKHCMRPDGFNSFEVIFLSGNDENEQEQSPILSSIQIGCLMNNFHIKEDEKILFEYGAEREKKSKSQPSEVEVGPESVLEQIRNFGGLKGLKGAKNKSDQKNELKELYNGLRLRVEIFFTHKPNTYEFVFSINGVACSRQIIKRKSARTMFQPIIRSSGIEKSTRMINLIVRHQRSALDNATIDIPQSNVKPNPWKAGMRLEAKDRKNPNILAIANITEVYEDNRIRINFDGWTSAFDFTVETDNADLHPCGYWEYVQRVLYKNVNTSKITPHFTFTRYDKPKSYDSPFSWRNYLTEINQEPVPLECFAYIQTEGMPMEYFPHGITKQAFTFLSCRHYYNVRVKYHKMNTFIQDEIVNKILYEHHLEMSNPTVTTSPGVILLPTPLDPATFTYPCLKQFQKSSNFVIHLTCNHRCISPLNSSTVISGTHLMDLDGGDVNKSDLNMPLITICMLTALDLARNQKRPIAPSTTRLIPNSSFDKHVIDFYMRRWLDLSAYIACFHSIYFHTKRVHNTESPPARILYGSYSDQDLYSVLRMNLNSIPINSSSASIINAQNQFRKYGECSLCCLLRPDERTDSSDLSIQRRLELIGAFAPCIFYLELSKQEKSVNKHRIVLDDDFFLKFNGLEIVDITNVTIDRLELNRQNRRCLKNLVYLSLKNNNLATINVDFQYLNQLVCLKLTDNPFQSLPLNCLSGKSLRSAELFELGRLIDLEPNNRISSELKSLSITESILTTLPATLGSDEQVKLTKLALNGVSWWGADGINVNEVVKYDSFEKKFLPFLDSQELTNIYHMYDEDSNGILSFSEINLMNAHIYRYIPRLRSTNTKIPNSGRSSVEPSASNLSQQDSVVTDSLGFPSVIFHLRHLTELSLQYQGIKIVPDAIKNLTELTVLKLSYCIELETLSAYVGFLPLKELDLTGCVSLKTPPIEITRRGHEQTMAFLTRLVSGSTACKRTKLMLVGLGGAGKTSLVRTFLQSHSDTPPVVTDGIDIVKWKVPLDDPDEFLEFSVWDFAGQSVYYHTHQFFLAKKAVYVLAWNIRLGAEHAGLDFWLSSICCHAPNAPIFVVGTHSDQVSRFDLRQDDLKRRYPQIVGFYNVSTYTGENMRELIDCIIKTTLALPYMDEQIPKVWLNFELLIGECKKDILEYREVSSIAHNVGIFDSSEILQAVQFLHDLGSLQYFSSEHLKNYVVINPQWIVNVMACIVSIKDSPVKDGRLFYSDMALIWGDYHEYLHPWILKLTEAFDLTFPVPDQNMNLVPCLLPEEEPEYTWNDDIDDPEIREMKVVYTFNYLPAGLFNRAQVRLFQFSDKSTIWRHGSLLVKNNHRAVIIRTDDRHIVIKIQGVRPDNILFLIHEVFEGLVNESFFGVTYDISFPCPDCVESGSSEPWQFSSSLINRAIELKSPTIQCHRFFHVASVTDLQTLIPPDSKSNYDLHLEYSVRDLKSYKQNMTVDVVYIYPAEHVPAKSEIENKTDPRKVKDDLTKRGFKIWTPESMKEFKIENHYLVVKEARFIIFGISTELIQNSANKNLYDAFQAIINILRKPIIPVLFGSDMKWKESDIGAVLTDKLYVNMQNPNRYEQRINELADLIGQEKNSQEKNEQNKDQRTDVFISYCWANSHDAVGKGTKPTATSIGWGDPRVLKDYLEGRGLNIWMDITRLGKSGVLQDIVRGLKSTKVVIACVSDEYTQSEVCRNEFLFAKNILRLPMILAIFGNGDKWRVTEVGMCSLTCSQVNFQFENPTAFEDIYSLLQTNLLKRAASATEISKDVITTPSTEETTTAAYQELFELTQRKFLRLTASFAETMTTRTYPRLFACDFIGEKEKSAQELARIEMAKQMTSQQQQQKEDNNERDFEADRQRDEELRRKQEEAEAVASTDEKEKEVIQEKRKTLCIRALCENEENWHSAGNPFEITEKVIIQNSAHYLSRIMLLLKHSDLALEILNTDEGEAELQKLDEIANSMNMEVKESYTYLRRCVMDFDLEEKYSGLKQCLMPSGKVLWLCEEHEKQPRVVPITGSLAGGYTRPQAEEKSEIVKALAKLNERIANNELPPPGLKVTSIGDSRRSSSAKQTSRNRRGLQYNRQESTLLKPQEQNILETDESIRENGDKNNRIALDEVEDENTDQRYPGEASVSSTDCSVM